MIRLFALFFSVLALVVISGVPAAYAQSASDLLFYKSEIPVQNQSAQVRRLAAQQGLQDVIVRMSGSRQVLTAPVINDAIARAERYVLQSQYVRLEDPLLREQGFNQKAAFLFSPDRVRELLLTNNLPYWSTTRPQTLVWIVEDTPELGRQFLSTDTLSPFVDGLAAAAKKAGTPLAYPLLDIDDLLALSPEQVWGLDEDAILAASEKYDADVILTGRVSQTSQGSVLTSLEILHRGQTQAIDTVQPDFTAAASVTIENMAQWLAGIYAIAQSEQAKGRVYLSIDNISRFGDYSQVLKYIRGLAFASNVSVAQLDGDTLLLAVMTDISIDKITTTLTLDRRIQVVDSSYSTRANAAAPSYGGDYSTDGSTLVRANSSQQVPNVVNQPVYGADRFVASATHSTVASTTAPTALSTELSTESTDNANVPLPKVNHGVLGSYNHPLMYRWMGN